MNDLSRLFLKSIFTILILTLALTFSPKFSFGESSKNICPFFHASITTFKLIEILQVYSAKKLYGQRNLIYKKLDKQRDRISKKDYEKKTLEAKKLKKDVKDGKLLPEICDEKKDDVVNEIRARIKTSINFSEECDLKANDIYNDTEDGILLFGWKHQKKDLCPDLINFPKNYREKIQKINTFFYKNQSDPVKVCKYAAKEMNYFKLSCKTKPKNKT